MANTENVGIEEVELIKRYKSTSVEITKGDQATLGNHDDERGVGSLQSPAYDFPIPRCSALGQMSPETLLDMSSGFLPPDRCSHIPCSWGALPSHVCSFKSAILPFQPKFKYHFSHMMPGGHWKFWGNTL